MALRSSRLLCVFSSVLCGCNPNPPDDDDAAADAAPEAEAQVDTSSETSADVSDSVDDGDTAPSVDSDTVPADSDEVGDTAIDTEPSDQGSPDADDADTDGPTGFVMVSVRHDGTPHGSSGVPAYQQAGSSLNISRDGRYVLFDSTASDITPDGTNLPVNLFRFDADSGRSILASARADGTEAALPLLDLRPNYMSADGRYVLLGAPDDAALVADDTNFVRDMFRKDLETGAVEWISRRADGTFANDAVYPGAIAPDGASALVMSRASNLTIPDIPYTPIYLFFAADGVFTQIADDATASNYCQLTASGDIVFEGGRNNILRSRGGVLSSASTDADGNEVTGFKPSASDDGDVVAFLHTPPIGSSGPCSDSGIRFKDMTTGALTCVPKAAQASELSISGDGRFAVFRSALPGLDARCDDGRVAHVYVHDRESGETRCVDITPNGKTGWSSKAPVISGDGRFIAFWTDSLAFAPPPPELELPPLNTSYAYLTENPL